MYFKRKHNPKGIIRYNYLEEFDNWSCTLEQAYTFYEDNGLVHLHQDGIIKCYQEFDELEPDEYAIGDLILTDLI